MVDTKAQNRVFVAVNVFVSAENLDILKFEPVRTDSPQEPRVDIRGTTGCLFFPQVNGEGCFKDGCTTFTRYVSRQRLHDVVMMQRAGVIERVAG